MSRLLRSVAMFVFLGLLVSTAANAKDKKKEVHKGIEPTGIEAFDSVFSQVGDIDKTLSGIENSMRDGKNNLNTALALQKGTPMTDGLAELKKRAGNKVSLAMDRGSVPKLQVEDGVPSNVRNAVDAVNQMTSNFGVSMNQITDLAPDMERLVKQTGKMPGKLKDEFSKTGGGFFDKLFKLPKISKALTNDLQVTAGLSDRAQGLTDRMNDIFGTVEGSFGVGGGTHHPSGGGNAGSPKGGAKDGKKK